MDEVLTRKLFRDRYFQSLKPKVKHFQKGGLSSLTPKEKAIYASTLAAPLLQAKGRGIGPALSALGEGVGKLPSTILAVEKAKGSGKGLRTLSESELKNYKLPTGTVAQIDGDGKITVVSKPSAEQMKELRGYKRTRGLLSDIAKDYIDLDKPVGPGDLNRIRGFLGKAAGTNYAKQYAGFKTKIDQATIFLTKAVSGAQVTDQERERIKELIPQVGDTERVFEAKLESLERYLSAAQNISEETGGDITSAIEILEKNGGVSQFVDFSAPIKYVVSDDLVDLTQN
tara:strand:+ start:181 stop:1035 length:855 start_codon:yes stop_codon:yes gene_type:complete